MSMVSAYYANMGASGYGELMELRKQLADMRHSGTLSKDVVIFAEHPPTILLGRDSKIEKEALAEKKLEVLDMPNKGVHFVGPGQAFFYVIHDYSRTMRPHDVAGHNRMLNMTIADSLAKLGLNVTPMENGKPLLTADKILSATHKVASHGFRIHLSKESVKHADVTGGGIASIEHVLGYIPLPEHVSEAVISSIKKNFGYDRLEECTITKYKDSVSIRSI